MGKNGDKWLILVIACDWWWLIGDWLVVLLVINGDIPSGVIKHGQLENPLK